MAPEFEYAIVQPYTAIRQESRNFAVSVDITAGARSDARRGILKFKPMSNHKGVSGRAVLAKILFKVRRRLHLDVADLRADAIAQPGEAGVRPRVPCLI